MKPRHAPRTAPLIASLVVAIAAVTPCLPKDGEDDNW